MTCYNDMAARQYAHDIAEAEERCDWACAEVAEALKDVELCASILRGWPYAIVQKACKGVQPYFDRACEQMHTYFYDNAEQIIHDRF